MLKLNLTTFLFLLILNLKFVIIKLTLIIFRLENFMGEFNYIVLDLEWNQSYNPKYAQLSNEIIEIGAYKLDSKLNIIDYFHNLIRPSVLKKIHFKVEKITNIKYEMLVEKSDFANVFENFLKWAGKDFIILTWSNSDILVLKSNLMFYNLDYNFLENNIDLQKFYASVTENSSNQYGLEKIIEKINITEDRPFHRALNDAYYSSLILKSLNKLNLKHYLKGFSSGLTPKVKIKKIPKTKFIESVVSENINVSINSRKEILRNEYINDLICPICKRNLDKTINWLKDKKSSFVCLGFCEDDGNVFSKIKINYKNDVNSVRKITALANSRTVGYIKYKKNNQHNNQDRLNFRKSK